MSKLLVIAMVFALFMFGMVVHFNTIMHEEAHATVTRYYGCENVTINYNSGFLGFYFSGSVSCDDADYTFNGEERFLHSLNEVINYNQQGTYTLLFTTLIVILLVVYVSRSSWEIKVIERELHE